jgi:hypothetical protein
MHWIGAISVLCMMLSGWAIYNASPSLPFTFPRWMTLGGWLAAGIAWHISVMWVRSGPTTGRERRLPRVYAGRKTWMSPGRVSPQCRWQPSRNQRVSEYERLRRPDECHCTLGPARTRRVGPFQCAEACELRVRRHNGRN